jgi:hypothetical protein
MVDLEASKDLGVDDLKGNNEAKMIRLLGLHPTTGQYPFGERGGGFKRGESNTGDEDLDGKEMIHPK